MRRRRSKAKRHAKVLEIIRARPIETQEELAICLEQEGFEVTQATVSRDIKELGITKAPTGSGKYRYFAPQERSFEDFDRRMKRLFQDSVVSIDYSENLLVVRTLTGNAHAVAAVIDKAGIPEIVGTIAGDDTILIVVKPKSAVISVMERFARLRAQPGE
ncbi:MAG: arginine repressor [Firmicutes bacterium]|jgi:transcriptional regulator of arginine metabolism|nr:arginine repressor [Bacillota bacterium]